MVFSTSSLSSIDTCGVEFPAVLMKLEVALLGLLFCYHVFFLFLRALAWRLLNVCLSALQNHIEVQCLNWGLLPPFIIWVENEICVCFNLGDPIPMWWFMEF